MATQLENTGNLERKLSMTIAMADIDREVEQRLRKLARTVKMPGFRPGKVPMKIVTQSYGGQVRAEVLGDVVGKAFSEGIAEHSLRVAGEPSIAPREGGDEGALGFDATFEVYPEIAVPTLESLEIERVGCEIGEAEIDKTIEILRKQRVTWSEVDRAAADGDRATIDFVGKIDDVAFEGGTAEGFAFVLGEGRMLPDFEAAVRGMKAGESRTAPVAFPEDYGSKELAGKTASFEITTRKVEEPVLPTVDADFARELGQADGDVEAMRQDIRRNLEREVGQRVRGRTKSNVMDSLAAASGFELPKALVRSEGEALAERARNDLAARGVDVKDIPVPADAFTEQAERRVRLGLLVGEIVRREKLQAKPDQIRAQIEEFAQAYENPAEVVRHYFSDRNRLAEIEALVIEQNVVDWALAGAKVSDKALTFDELMAAG
ncbi:MAG: trigger factor [Burkholderiaceae bacterium]|jgi:trigger factor|nr:trigger factor [Burkholderiaceae bacterium]MEB2319801.1 trigger factor [Pseudomonadota bacterium]